MGIAAISSTSMAGLLLAPLHALVGFFAPWQAAGAIHDPHSLNRRQPAQASLPAVPALKPEKRPVSRIAGSFQTAPVRPACSRLRVIRVMDAGCAPHAAGRMMISGRMADVCAELDRMALREAQGACLPTR